MVKCLFRTLTHLKIGLSPSFGGIRISLLFFTIWSSPECCADGGHLDEKVLRCPICTGCLELGARKPLGFSLLLGRGIDGTHSWLPVTVREARKWLALWPRDQKLSGIVG